MKGPLASSNPNGSLFCQDRVSVQLRYQGTTESELTAKTYLDHAGVAVRYHLPANVNAANSFATLRLHAIPRRLLRKLPAVAPVPLRCLSS
jgi:hypothetical protein